MKKIIVLAAFLVFGSLALMAQAPPAPPSNPSSGGNGPVGGSAPVGEGIVLLMALAAGYGGRKVFNYSNKYPA